MTTQQSNISIIVPTFQEVQNIPELVARVAQLPFTEFELIIVDDHSQDGIVEVVKQLQLTYPWLKLIVREQDRGLSASALEGFSAAQNEILVLMDADLSHPPEKIPAMVHALLEEQADFVIGSRYVAGGSTDEEWPLHRKLGSWLSTGLANVLLLAKIKDPLSGFFALKKVTLSDGQRFDPTGWKIGLELMMKCRCQKIVEVPIHFSERKRGASKLSGKVICQYFWQVRKLALYRLFS